MRRAVHESRDEINSFRAIRRVADHVERRPCEEKRDVEGGELDYGPGTKPPSLGATCIMGQAEPFYIILTDDASVPRLRAPFT